MALRKEAIESVIGTLPVCQLRQYDALMDTGDTEHIMFTLIKGRSTLPDRIEALAQTATTEFLQDRVVTAMGRYVLTEGQVKDLILASLKQGAAQAHYDLGASQQAADKITQELGDDYMPLHRLED